MGYISHSRTFLEKEEGRNERKERNIDVTEASVVCFPYASRLDWELYAPRGMYVHGLGSNPQPRCVPWLGVKFATFRLWSYAPTN